MDWVELIGLIIGVILFLSFCIWLFMFLLITFLPVLVLVAIIGVAIVIVLVGIASVEGFVYWLSGVELVFDWLSLPEAEFILASSGENLSQPPNPQSSSTVLDATAVATFALADA